MQRQILEFLRRTWTWLKSREPLLLVVCLGFAVSTWAFIEIADEVLEQETQAFDKWVIRSLRQADDPATPLGSAWVQEMGRDLTAFGGVAALVFFTVIVAGYLWIEKKPRVIALLLAAALGGLLL
ncbi:MAG TPA: phosphoesterase, partial [Planctomycetaceae bacterium]|nr:phosphoesterase [Planctomycetaceae bacterium]